MKSMATYGELLQQALGLHNSGQLEPAANLYGEILRTNPTHPDAYHLYGVLEYQRGHADMAIPLIRQAIALNASVPAFYSNLGIVLRAQGQRTEAIACYRQALALDPQFAGGYFNLGNVLQEDGSFDEAVTCFESAVRLNPRFADAHCNMGVSLKALGRLSDATACFQNALTANPAHINALINLGLAHKATGELKLAQERFEEALRYRSDHPAGRWHSAQLKLLQGDFRGGWADFECRWQATGTAPAHTDRPLWDGSPLEGKTILLHAERGLGNSIQFIRYAPLIKRNGGTVLFECQPELVELLKGASGVDQIFPAGSLLPHFDVQAPLMSVPATLRTTRTTIPAKIPYLHADPQLVTNWRKNLQSLGVDPQATIGIAWQGDPGFPDDIFRSIPLRHFEPLARIPNVTLLSLQKAPGAEQIHTVGFAVRDLGVRLDSTNAFADTAAIMMSLRLVVTSDTAIAHLAGALGVPVWVVLPLIPDWRWRLNHSESRWYPSMRLFRQKKAGDWQEVMERIAEQIRSTNQVPRTL
jgi:tetratricopeptide (TPR) repeat protein